MKRIAAILLISALLAALLCACAGTAVQEPTEPIDYTGTYVYQNTTMREISIRTVTVNPDGTYTYTRVSTFGELNGEYSGTWIVDEEGYIIFTGSISGLTSRGKLSDDTLLLDIADVGHGEDTIGDGIYQYQFPEDEETPDEATEAVTEAPTEAPTKAKK